MYQTSQGYCNAGTGSYNSGCAPSKLEYIANNSCCGYQSSGNTFYSAIEPIKTEINFIPSLDYSNFDYNKSSRLTYDLFKTNKNYDFIPDNFLKPGKEGLFVGKAEEVKELVEEAFEKMFNVSFPNNIKISVLDEKRFRKLAPSPATIGFSINRRKMSLLSEIFILNDTLGRVMLTIGHELGHVLTETLEDQRDEEAKAYAFSLAWIRIIKENNIANLGDSIIIEKPAQNGLHNVAFDFVRRLVGKGKEMLEVYTEIISKSISIKINEN